MSDYHRIQIRCQEADPHRTEVLLDGEPLRGVCRVEFVAQGASPEAPATVRIEMYAREFEVDLEMVERVFVSSDAVPDPTPLTRP